MSSEQVPQFQVLRAIDPLVMGGSMELKIAARATGASVSLPNATGGLRKVSSLEEIRGIAANSASRLMLDAARG